MGRQDRVRTPVKIDVVQACVVAEQIERITVIEKLESLKEDLIGMSVRLAAMRVEQAPPTVHEKLRDAAREVLTAESSVVSALNEILREEIRLDNM